MGDFLRFEVMITPILIQILFWIAVAGTVIIGIAMIFTTRDAPAIAAGVLVIIFGPIAAPDLCRNPDRAVPDKRPSPAHSAQHRTSLKYRLGLRL